MPNENDNELMQDPKPIEYGPDIHERCNRHAQLMEKIGELVVGLQDEKNRREEMIADRKKVTDSLAKLLETEIKLINFRLDTLENKNTDLINARLVAVLERVEVKFGVGGFNDGFNESRPEKIN